MCEPTNPAPPVTTQVLTAGENTGRTAGGRRLWCIDRLGRPCTRPSRGARRRGGVVVGVGTTAEVEGRGAERRRAALGLLGSHAPLLRRTARRFSPCAAD